MKRKGIKELSKIERPEEKLIKYGVNKLSEKELLALILRTGTKDRDVLSLSELILRKFGRELPYVKFKELKNFKGIGKAKAARIVATFELGKRLLKDKKTKPLLTPQEVWKYLYEFSTKKKEYFIILYLDVRNQEIKREVISVGTLNASIVHPREVFEPAIKNNASSIIIAHNHPSGNLEPSKEDIKLTKRLIEAGKILGIGIIDHVILSKEAYFSFKEKNLFNFKEKD